ncbi:hypothetical protein AB0I99_22650 [Streptomyces spongiicola]|uniref:hypothetical protein n=1 Tax=Streptomyces spongiicola TaxID=1690221 RepID=UPI0021CE2A22|nr:hypothetical protein [Streptomyces spongiicola]
MCDASREVASREVAALAVAARAPSSARLVPVGVVVLALGSTPIRLGLALIVLGAVLVRRSGWTRTAHGPSGPRRDAG